MGNGGDSAMVERTGSAVLEPTPEFRAFFLNPNLVAILFKCYELVRDDSDMAHICMQSLIQLSTLQGVVFSDTSSFWTTDATNESSTRLDFLNNFLRAFVDTFRRWEDERLYSFFYLQIKCMNLLYQIEVWQKKISWMTIFKNNKAEVLCYIQEGQ